MGNSIPPSKRRKHPKNPLSQKADVVPEELRQEIRKIRWGIHQNKIKMLKIAEITLSHVTKIQNIEKKLLRRLNRNTSKPKTGKSRKTSGKESLVKQEIEYLEQERKKLERIKKLIEASQVPRPQETAPALPKMSSPDKHRVLILVIEDEAVNIKMIEHFLTRESYSVISVSTAEEGLEKATVYQPALILLDLMMPGMNGYQFLSCLKSDKRISHIPVIVLSSLSRESDILKGLELGAKDYIVKPYFPQVLISKIKKIVTGKNAKFSHNSDL